MLLIKLSNLGRLQKTLRKTARCQTELSPSQGIFSKMFRKRQIRSNRNQDSDITTCPLVVLCEILNGLTFCLFVLKQNGESQELMRWLFKSDRVQRKLIFQLALWNHFQLALNLFIPAFLHLQTKKCQSFTCPLRKYYIKFIRSSRRSACLGLMVKTLSACCLNPAQWVIFQLFQLARPWDQRNVNRQKEI